MASKNFYVHNGLTVGDLTIDAATGDINTTGTITATNITISGNSVLTTASIAANAVSSIAAGTDTAVSAAIGNVTVWNTSTLESVTSRGATTNQVIRINNTSEATNTDSGAIVIQGGMGIKKDIHIDGIIHLMGPNSTIEFGPYDVSSTDGKTWWVQNNGIDEDPNNFAGAGKQLWTAFKTIKHALSYAQSGDTVLIQPGSYTEEFPMTVPQGVSVRGAGLRECFIQPTTATNTQTAFFLGGETTISDFTVGNFYKPGYAFRFTPGAKITTRSPYIQRFSVLTKGSVTTPEDPYGFDAGDAGNGAYIDGGVLDSTSLHPSLLFNEATFIVPNATAYYMTNGARAEMLNCFTYFADKAIYTKADTPGYGGVGKTRLNVSGVSGTFTSSDILYYLDPAGNVVTTGTIASYDGTYIFLNGPVWGFDVVYDRSAKTATPSGNIAISTATTKFGSGSINVTGSTGYVKVVSDNDFQFGTGNYTFETWVRTTATSRTQYIYKKGTLTTASVSAYVNTSNNIVITHDAVSITGSTALSTSTWYHVRVVRRSATNGIYLYLNGALETSNTGTTANVNNTDPLIIGNSGESATNEYWTGFIDDFRVSNIARNTSTFTAPTAALKSDPATILLLHFDDSVGSTVYNDDVIATQNIYSTGSSPATASRIDFADYHQFGAEIRSIGCASVFGNTGVTADGTGTDLKLISFNLSNIGSGKDLSNDYSLANQANEIIQLNGGKIYYQTVDQNGDFRVGDSFFVNQRTGAVSFGTANVNLGSLDQLVITNGVNNATILPTSISVGNIDLSGNTLATLSGNLTLNPSGSTTIIDSITQLNDVVNAISSLNAVSTTSAAMVVTGGVGIGKDLRVGGTIYGTATTATNADKWTTPRTITLAGDLSGSVAFDGNTDFTLTATIAANSVELGTDTTGNYVATGATSGFGLSGSTNAENATFTVTSNATSSNTISTLVFRDGSGNFSAGTITASLTGNATSADKWSTAKTITLSGDLTGNVSIDGSSGVTLTATIATNSVELGTDTTGNYVATGATSGFGLSGSTNAENATFTVTSNATSSNTISTIVFRDGTGNFSAGTITASLSGTASSATDVAGGTANQILYQVGANDTGFVTAPTVTDTYLRWNGSAFVWSAVASTFDGGTINTALIINSSTQATSTITGALRIVNGGAGIGGNLWVGGTINGNLTGTASLATDVAGGTANQILYQVGANDTGFVTAPTVTDTYLKWTGSAFAWASVAGGTFDGGTINTALIINSSTQATSTITGALRIVNGGAGIGGNLYVGGNGVFGSALNFTPINANIQYGGNTNGFLQLAVQNTNAGTTSTTDIVAFSNNGNNDGGYIDFGITSSAYADPTYDLSGPGDGFLYVVGTTSGVGKLTISTYQPQDIVFSTGGGDTIHEAGRWKHAEGLKVVTTTASTSTVTGAVVVTGGVGIGGDLNVGGTVTAPTVVAGNILDAGKVVALAMGMAMP